MPIASPPDRYARTMPHSQTDLLPVDFPYQHLSRWPDPEGDNLFASDATDRLLVDLAAPIVRQSPPGSVVILGDRYGALTLGCASLGARGIRSHQDAYGGQLALNANRDKLADSLNLSADAYTNLELSPELFAGARVVLVQLPKDLAQLDHWAGLIATHADPSVKVLAGGRLKYMTRAMNGVLERYFEDVSASLARQKSRVLFAGVPRADHPLPQTSPDKHYDSDLDLWVHSYPGAFAAGRVDHGTRFLAQFIREAAPPVTEQPVAVDLGCGTGVLTAVLLKSHPEYRVIATDRSAVAVRSATATLRRNIPGAGYEVRQDHALFQQPDASLDLIVCNPPFHAEASISTALSDLLFREASRALRPGGVMLTVFNSHLPHRRALERLVGPTEQLGRNQKFTVTRTRKADRPPRP